MTRPISNDSSELLAKLIADHYGQKPSGAAQSGALDGLVERRFEQAYQMRFGASQETGDGAAGVQDSSAPTEGLSSSLRAIDDAGLEAGQYAEDFISGTVSSLNELVVRAKRAELTFNYSLAIRDRLVEAYREVMRMTV